METGKTRRLLCTTPKRAKVIRQVEETCKERGFALEVDLRYLTCSEMWLLLVQLQTGDY